MASEMLLRCLFILLLFVPFLLCALAVWRWHGGSRFAAAILLVVTGVALATDIYGAIHGGNLAGVLTIAGSLPTLLFLGILAVTQNSSKRRTNDEKVDSSAEVVEPKGISRSDDTQVGNTGLAHLKGLTGLELLELRRTQVTDTGLEHLGSLTNLRELHLPGEQVTSAGLNEMRKTLPKTRITR